MRSGNLDFAFFPPDGFVIAQRETDAQVLLKSVRFGNPFYWSAIIVRKDSGFTSLADLEDKSIAWVDPNSAAGYVFPRAEITLAGIEPDDFFSNQVFSGGHDAAVLSVLNARSTPPPPSPTTLRTSPVPGPSSLEEDRAAELHSIFYSRPIPGDTFSVSREFRQRVPGTDPADRCGHRPPSGTPTAACSWISTESTIWSQPTAPTTT